jgi:hypothetical protein
MGDYYDWYVHREPRNNESDVLMECKACGWTGWFDSGSTGRECPCGVHASCVMRSELAGAVQMSDEVHDG